METRQKESTQKESTQKESAQKESPRKGSASTSLQISISNDVYTQSMKALHDYLISISFSAPVCEVETSPPSDPDAKKNDDKKKLQANKLILNNEFLGHVVRLSPLVTF